MNPPSSHRYVFSTEGHPFPVTWRLQTPVTADWPLTCTPNTTHPCPLAFPVAAGNQAWGDAGKGVGLGSLRPAGMARRQCPVLGTTPGLCFEADRHPTHTYAVLAASAVVPQRMQVWQRRGLRSRGVQLRSADMQRPWVLSNAWLIVCDHDVLRMPLPVQHWWLLHSLAVSLVPLLT